MQHIVECVPNFSEGRNREKIGAITSVIETVPGAVLLDVDPGADTNRTVVTLVGEPDAVVEAAFRAIEEASRVIDMREHTGAHARMGATDVCPFVPVRGLTMDDCAELARKLGARVGDELGIPVYLYERAATDPERRNLANVRTGEYEGLAARVGNPRWTPDFGPHEFNARAGATAIGAREFLIAYNVNLNTRSKKLAHDIALDIRERGRRRRDASGKAVRDSDGQFETVPGQLKECKAVGWYIPEYGAAQISINLTNYHVTPVHAAFDAIMQGATDRGLRVTGSELVGLIPLEAIREAGIHYLRKQGLTAGVPERELIHVAVKSLGLEELGPFDPHEKIIEYRLRRENALVDLTVSDFADELSSDSPAPGGGSVASLMGNLSGALSAMVASLTVGKKGYEPAWEAMKDLGREAQQIKDAFRDDIDRDTDSFNQLMAAMRMKKATPEEIAARDHAVAEATKLAIEVPLGVLSRSVRTCELAEQVAEHGNRNSLSDAGVAALAACACAEGAYYNVLINLADLDEPEWAENALETAGEALTRVREIADRVRTAVEGKLEEAARAPQRT
jgi:glutamate formiminotransferase/formiminotetrahydrofolate cyclodeaminase